MSSCGRHAGRPRPIRPVAGPRDSAHAADLIPALDPMVVAWRTSGHPAWTAAAGATAVPAESRAVRPAGGLHCPRAGLVSGDISSSETDIPVAWRPGCPHRHTSGLPGPRGFTKHVAAPAPAPRAVHRRVPKSWPSASPRPRPPSAIASSSSATTTSATRSCAGPMPAATRSASRSWPRSTRRPTTSCSAASTSWPSRPTSSPPTTSR